MYILIINLFFIFQHTIAAGASTCLHKTFIHCSLLLLPPELTKDVGLQTQEQQCETMRVSTDIRNAQNSDLYNSSFF